ncbi:hypothetical protein O3P69_010719 [Scylla paramamosain]|uniref:Uncharacterized protein n=1 Tax=Scylla paramamosain TaxID=85552 RepID=A0AAW0TEQ3_SCYPA
MRLFPHIHVPRQVLCLAISLPSGPALRTSGLHRGASVPSIGRTLTLASSLLSCIVRAREGETLHVASIRGSPLLLYYTRRPVKCVLWDIKDSLEGLGHGVFLLYLARRVWLLLPSQRVPPLLAATHTFIFDLYGPEHATFQWLVPGMKTFRALSGCGTRPQPPVRFSIDWNIPVYLSRHATHLYVSSASVPPALFPASDIGGNLSVLDTPESRGLVRMKG